MPNDLNNLSWQIIDIRGEPMRDSKTKPLCVAEMSTDQWPLAYLITFSCYGSHLHGDETGSVDRKHNEYDSPFLSPDPRRWKTMRARMKSPPYVLDRLRREVVLTAIREICPTHGWVLLAAHVRTNHAHVVVQAAIDPETVLNAFKSHCSKRLNEQHMDPNPVRRWIRHGSTKYLWTIESVENAIDYVLFKQGPPMEVYPADAGKLWGCLKPGKCSI